MSTKLQDSEEATLHALRATYCFMRDRHSQQNGKIPLSVLKSLADFSKAPGKTFDEINFELIVRSGRNFKNDNAFRNKLFAWHTELRSSSNCVDISLTGSSLLVRAWLEGLITYFMKEIRVQLFSIGLEWTPPQEIILDEEDETEPKVFMPVFDHPLIIEEDLFSLSRRASVIITTGNYRSACFLKCLKILPYFLKSLEIALKLARSFADSAAHPCDRSMCSNTHSRSSGRMEEPIGDLAIVLGNHLRREGWLFYLVAILLGVSRAYFEVSLQADPIKDGRDVAVNEEVGPSFASQITKGEVVAALQASTRLIRMALTGVDQGTDSFRIIALQHVHRECWMSFPPHRLSMQLAKAIAEPCFSSLSSPLEAGNEVFPMATLRDLPLFQVVMKEMWDFIEVAYAFSAEVGLKNSWVGTVIMQQLFLFNFEKVKKTGEDLGLFDYDERPLISFPCSTDNSPTSQRTPNGPLAEVFTTDNLQQSFLFACLRLFLRTLVREFSNDTSDNDNHHQHHDDSDNINNSSNEARRLIEALAVLSGRAVIPLSQRMRVWPMLGLGPQPTKEIRFGQECFSAVMHETLYDLIRGALQRSTTLPGNGPSHFFSFLMRTEARYYDLTNSDPAQVTLGLCRGLFHRAMVELQRETSLIDTSQMLVKLVVHFIHTLLLRAEGGLPDSPTATTTTRIEKTQVMSLGSSSLSSPRVTSGETLEDFPNKHELHTVMRLANCIVDRSTFFARYLDLMRVRLLARPPPSFTSDEAFERSVQAYETLVLQLLSNMENVSNAELKRIKLMNTSFHSKTLTSDANEEDTGLTLVVRELDWRVWGHNVNDHLLLNDREEPPALSHNHRVGPPSEDEPLPFPSDLWEKMRAYQANFQDETNGVRMLRWHKPSLTHTSFAVGYPKCEQGGIVVNGSLLLQQLFLAIGQYGKKGVSYATLSRRAAIEEDRLRETLRQCTQQDMLLEVVHGSEEDSGEERIRLNYDFTLPPEEGTRKEFTYHLPVPRARTAASIESAAKTVTSREWRVYLAAASVAQIMKTSRKATYEFLLQASKDHLFQWFELSRQVFKSAIEELIQKGVLARHSDGDNEALLQYLA